MFVLIARYWNEIEWVHTSLKYILQWDPDRIIISEGNWSPHPSFKGREFSTDGTREIVQQFVKDNKDRATFIEGVRNLNDYRKNQAATCNKALEISKAKHGDWFITIDCDSFIHDWAINIIKSIMMSRRTGYYFPYMINHFFWDIETCATLRDIHGNLLPRKISKGAKFINANHYGLKGKYYTDNKKLVSGMNLDNLNIQGHHYLGIKSKQRDIDRYNMGDRLKQRPEKRGYDKKRKEFKGRHPVIVQEKLFGDQIHAVS